MADTIFTAQVPSHLNEFDGQPVNTGNVFQATAQGTISQVRYYKPTTTPGSVNVAIYDLATETLQAEVDLVVGSLSAGWNTGTLDVPLVIGAGEVNDYYAVRARSDGRYVAFSGLVAAGALTNGALTAPQHGGAGGNNGRYEYGAEAFPTQSGGGTLYGADVIFEPSSGEVEVTDLDFLVSFTLNLEPGKGAEQSFPTSVSLELTPKRRAKAALTLPTTFALQVGGPPPLDPAIGGWRPGVGRHVHYFGSPDRKPRPGVITALSANGGVVIRVGHHGETYGNSAIGVLRQDATDHAGETNVYTPA